MFTILTKNSFKRIHFLQNPRCQWTHCDPMRCVFWACGLHLSNQSLLLAKTHTQIVDRWNVFTTHQKLECNLHHKIPLVKTTTSSMDLKFNFFFDSNDNATMMTCHHICTVWCQANHSWWWPNTSWTHDHHFLYDRPFKIDEKHTTKWDHHGHLNKKNTSNEHLHNIWMDCE